MLLALLLLGAGTYGGVRLVQRVRAQAAVPAYPKVRTDPGIDPSHPLGVLPCPGNPPTPPGTTYWTGPVSPALTEWAIKTRDAHPIGSIIEDIVDGQHVIARIEYHTLQAATGKEGCFKGLNLLKFTSAQAGANEMPVGPPAFQVGAVFLDVPGYGTVVQGIPRDGFTIGYETYDDWYRALGGPAGMAYRPHG
jgi:hypothetical protein